MFRHDDAKQAHHRLHGRHSRDVSRQGARLARGGQGLAAPLPHATAVQRHGRHHDINACRTAPRAHKIWPYPRKAVQSHIGYNRLVANDIAFHLSQVRPKKLRGLCGEFRKALDIRNVLVPAPHYHRMRFICSPQTHAIIAA